MKVGIQLYSVRDHMAQDPVDTIRKVVKTGYRYLEVANHHADKDTGVGFGVPAAEIKKLLTDLDAQVFSAHVYPLTEETIQPVLDYHREIGTKYIVVPIAFFSTRDDVLKLAEHLNKIGERCREAGMELLFHNHFHEFQILEGDEAYSLLMARTDPELVKIELDTYWAMRGGMDPVAVMKQYGRRVRLIHQKDYPKGKDDQINVLKGLEHTQITRDVFVGVIAPDTFTEIGTGIMDIQSIINVGNTVCHSDTIVLEQDRTAHDELESIAISMEHFRKFKGLDWGK